MRSHRQRLFILHQCFARVDKIINYSLSSNEKKHILAELKSDLCYIINARRDNHQTY